MPHVNCQLPFWFAVVISTPGEKCLRHGTFFMFFLRDGQQLGLHLQLLGAPSVSVATWYGAQGQEQSCTTWLKILRDSQSSKMFKEYHSESYSKVTKYHAES